MQGFVQVYTGDGKGKTTAALGLAVRAVGAGLRVYVGQFIKNAEYSELNTLRHLSESIAIEQYGLGCMLVHAPTREDIDAARRGLTAVDAAMASGAFEVVIADEINVACALGLLAEEDLLGLMARRPPAVELVLTGRGAPDAVLARADLVTEMRSVKHYYERGIAARKGIEG
ncbi:MAG: cob(I)yrinic acid a,c-diamide adenosyltransferase [Desulfobulbus sp.]|jgi:cob(I)alamin adenosyltransferase|uniref:cob(I)yrinic acid a,c-diamide adenosyltransferase n=1 Tax=Desulfobulbus sp. TaxID=895 RepID=UPI0028514D9C|nr:cob(I)yrinic acid a,c-diamide adenosyltransferase [Desulfobulbus sp.]MDR2551341.1 cob(I)yrinic acid a,c-diamide adenosyltransferase [Desulfobulbus sp.]